MDDAGLRAVVSGLLREANFERGLQLLEAGSGEASAVKADDVAIVRLYATRGRISVDRGDPSVREERAGRRVDAPRALANLEFAPGLEQAVADLRLRAPEHLQR